MPGEGRIESRVCTLTQPGHSEPTPTHGNSAAHREDVPIHKRRHTLHVLLALLATYLVLAYVILPLVWHRHEDRHPALRDAEKITKTSSGIPGDPVNIAFIGSEAALHRAMLAAKWYPADPITLESSLRIAADVVLRRPYADAPVSALYLYGRKQDLAFEQPVGDDPRSRHHVRYWRSSELDKTGNPVWFGAATKDVHVGLSHDTGQITHHIGPDVDAERDKIIADIKAAGYLDRMYWIDEFHVEHSGRNGGGDPWNTDGRLAVGVLENHRNAPTAAVP